MFFLKTKTILSSAFLLSLSALFSRILGVARDNLLANFFPKELTDVYFAAFRIPDFLYAILIGGGIVAAFLPVFSESFKKSSLEAKLLANNVLAFFFLSLVLIAFLLVIFSPQLINFITPGFDEAKKVLAVSLTRIMLLSPILLGVSAIFVGILQYFNLFFTTALAPLFYNLGIIFGILFLAPYLGIKGIAWGVILGAFFHVLVQIPPLWRLKFLPRFSFNFKFPGLKKILKLMAPRTLGSAAYQLNFIIITALASTLSVGAISVFNFANNLQYLPVGIIGISFAQASFPALSRAFSQGRKKEFLKNFSQTFSQILFFILPLSILIFLLREEIVGFFLGTSLLGDGYFGKEEIQLTSASLGIFSLALLATTFLPFLARVFFSVQDTLTPVKISLGGMVLNIFFCYLFVWLLNFSNPFQKALLGFLNLKPSSEINILGLPLGLSFSLVFQFLLYLFLLKRKITYLEFRKIFLYFKKILLASFLMGIFVYLASKIFSSFLLDQERIFFQLIGGSLIGGLSYLFLSFLLGTIPKSQ